MRAVTDSITVAAATIQTVAITATVSLVEGPQKASVLEAARNRARALAKSQHKIGGKLTPFMVGAALQGEGVEDISVTAPSQDVSKASYMLHPIEITERITI